MDVKVENMLDIFFGFELVPGQLNERDYTCAAEKLTVNGGHLPSDTASESSVHFSICSLAFIEPAIAARLGLSSFACTTRGSGGRPSSVLTALSRINERIKREEGREIV